MNTKNQVKIVVRVDGAFSVETWEGDTWKGEAVFGEDVSMREVARYASTQRGYDCTTEVVYEVYPVTQWLERKAWEGPEDGVGARRRPQDATLVGKKVAFAEKVMAALADMTDVFDEDTLLKIGMEAEQSGLMIGDESGDRLQICVPVEGRGLVTMEKGLSVEVRLAEGWSPTVESVMRDWEAGEVFRVVSEHTWSGRACTAKDFASGTKVWLWNSQGKDFIEVTMGEGGVVTKKEYIKPFID